MPNLSIVTQAVKYTGQPLDRTTRSFMEHRFGKDFGDVRVHSGASAAESAQAVNARAYTVGSDIVLRDAYDSASAAGRRLLAHELTHVVQQHGASSVAQRAGLMSQP